MSIHCKYCGSGDVSFNGIQDGSGDYGDMLCEEWECSECGATFDGTCEDEIWDGAVDNDGEGFGYEPYPTEDSSEYFFPPNDLSDPDEPIDPVWSES